MNVAFRQSMWKNGFNPLDYCFVSRYNFMINTDVYVQHTANIGVDAVVLFAKELTVGTGFCIFGHSGSNNGALSDGQDFRFFNNGDGRSGVYFDRGNGRAYFWNSAIVDYNWHRISLQGRSSVAWDGDLAVFNNLNSVTADSANCTFNFFGWPGNTVEQQQNDMAIRYVRIYDIRSGQDLTYFVPDFSGMRDLVTGKIYAPASSNARFEVVKWTSLSQIEGWK